VDIDQVWFGIFGELISEAQKIIHTISLYLFLSKLGLISLNASTKNTKIDKTVNKLVPVVNISLYNSLCLTAVSGLVSFFFKPIRIKKNANI
jgi:hypothetical protein